MRALFARRFRRCRRRRGVAIGLFRDADRHAAVPAAHELAARQHGHSQNALAHEIRAADPKHLLTWLLWLRHAALQSERDFCHRVSARFRSHLIASARFPSESMRRLESSSVLDGGKTHS